MRKEEIELSDTDIELLFECVLKYRDSLLKQLNECQNTLKEIEKVILRSNLNPHK